MKSPILLFLNLLPVSPIFADETSARASAERIVDLIGGIEQVEIIQNALFQRMEKDVISRGMPAAGAAELHQAMQLWFTNNFGKAKVRSMAADIYLQEFTEAELSQIVSFYETPVGQKLLKQKSAILQKVRLTTAKIMDDKKDSLQAAIMPIFEKYGMTNKPNASLRGPQH